MEIGFDGVKRVKILDGGKWGKFEEREIFSNKKMKKRENATCGDFLQRR